jgi:hypothetical protein
MVSFSKIGKAWVYLRGGYSVYFSFVVGVGNSLMIAYFVVLTGTGGCPPEDTGFLCTIRPFFPNFGIFVLAAIVIGAPIMMLVGRFHFKKQLFKSEMDVTWQNNPWYFKLIGHQKVMYEIFLQILSEIKQQNQFDIDKVKRIVELENKIRFLLDGGSMHDFKT